MHSMITISGSYFCEKYRISAFSLHKEFGLVSTLDGEANITQVKQVLFSVSNGTFRRSTCISQRGNVVSC